MGILGLTHDESGTAILKLPVAIKVAIGEGPDPNDSHSHPKKLDHFVFKRKDMRGKEIVWVDHSEVAGRYGESPREIGIILMDDDIDNVFRTSYAWWNKTECKCRGDLVAIGDGYEMRAVRKTEKHPEGEAWPGNYKYTDGTKKGQPCEPCGEGCPDLEEEGRCKPSADLYFQLDKFPMMGATCRLHTSSYRSIRQISSALQQAQQTFGGLSGIRMMLKVRPEKGTYEEDGKKKTTTLHILSLELDAEDWKKLLASATEMKQLFSQQRKLLGARRIEIVEDEADRAPEIASEFHPQASDEEPEKPAGPPKAMVPESDEEMQQLARIHKLCLQLNYNQAKEYFLLGQYTGKRAELEADLQKELANILSEKGNGSAKGASAAVVGQASSTKTGTQERWSF